MVPDSMAAHRHPPGQPAVRPDSSEQFDRSSVWGWVLQSRRVPVAWLQQPHAPPPRGLLQCASAQEMSDCRSGFTRGHVRGGRQRQNRIAGLEFHNFRAQRSRSGRPTVPSCRGRHGMTRSPAPWSTDSGAAV